jgi:hypothetical protein
MKHTVTVTLSDSDIYYLRKLYDKDGRTKAATLALIAIKRAVAESAKQELAETGYAPVEEKTPCQRKTE